MGHIYKNITGTTAVNLSPSDASTLKVLNIVNTKDSGSIKVDLYINYSDISEGLERANESRDYLPDHGGIMLEPVEGIIYKYYIIKNVEIPSGVSLVLEKNELAYDTSKYDLYIVLDATDSTADIILQLDTGAGVSGAGVSGSTSTATNLSSSGGISGY